MPKAMPMERIMLTVPPDLLLKIEDSTRKLHLTRSEFIRQAVEGFLEELRRQELRDLLKEGYQIHAERDRRISEEFAYADYEATVKYLPPYNEEL